MAELGYDFFLFFPFSSPAIPFVLGFFMNGMSVITPVSEGKHLKAIRKEPSQSMLIYYEKHLYSS